MSGEINVPEELKPRQNDNEHENGEIEIPASTIRSGLENLELQATEVVNRLEKLHLPSQSAEPVHTTAKGFLNAEPKDPNDVFVDLEHLIVNAHADDSEDSDEGEIMFPPLSSVTRTALICHSLSAYLEFLDREKLSIITARIITDTNRWLSHVFRFLDSSASYHTDKTDSLLRAVRLAIVTRCPAYLDDGLRAIQNPCLYISEQSPTNGLQYVCRQLGLPNDSIRLVPCTSSGGVSQTAMDISALQRLISSDIAANCTPCFVVADIGSSVFGCVDNILRLQDICKASGVWLHCQGHSLAAIALTQGAGESSSIADSLSLQLGNWLGIPSIPVVLLHREIQNIALSIFESDPLRSRRLSSLPMWSALQSLGRDEISERILLSFRLCQIVYEIVSKFIGLRILSKIPGGASGGPPIITELINKPLSPSLLFEAAVCVVAFQFDGVTAASMIPSDGEEIPPIVVPTAGEGETDESAVGAEHDHKLEEKELNKIYDDRSNRWLGDNLIRELPFDLGLKIINNHPVHGTFLRYCPFDFGVQKIPPTLGDLQTFADLLGSKVDVLRATNRHRITFRKIIEKSEVLRLVEIPGWTGLGCVRYVPEGWESLLTDQAKTELNKLNANIVDELKTADSAFSLAEATDGLTCVVFGMVNEEEDIDGMLNLVVNVGRKVQENSKVLDSMTEIVKKGIEAATADLQRETEEKLWSEGILRHVPVVGNFVNWWSPPPKENGIKGRSLNLTQGVVESTENIYKYHMQMSGGSSQLPGNRSPPAPMIQRSVSTGHSRTVSQSSATSNNNVS